MKKSYTKDPSDKAWKKFKRGEELITIEPEIIPPRLKHYFNPNQVMLKAYLFNSTAYPDMYDKNKEIFIESGTKLRVVGNWNRFTTVQIEGSEKVYLCQRSQLKVFTALVPSPPSPDQSHAPQ